MDFVSKTGASLSTSSVAAPSRNGGLVAMEEVSVVVIIPRLPHLVPPHQDTDPPPALEDSGVEVSVEVSAADSEAEEAVAASEATEAVSVEEEVVAMAATGVVTVGTGVVMVVAGEVLDIQTALRKALHLVPVAVAEAGLAATEAATEAATAMVVAVAEDPMPALPTLVRTAMVAAQDMETDPHATLVAAVATEMQDLVVTATAIENSTANVRTKEAATTIHANRGGIERASPMRWVCVAWYTLFYSSSVSVLSPFSRQG